MIFLNGRGSGWYSSATEENARDAVRRKICASASLLRERWWIHGEWLFAMVDTAATALPPPLECCCRRRRWPRAERRLHWRNIILTWTMLSYLLSVCSCVTSEQWYAPHGRATDGGNSSASLTSTYLLTCRFSFCFACWKIFWILDFYHKNENDTCLLDTSVCCIVSWNFPDQIRPSWYLFFSRERVVCVLMYASDNSDFKLPVKVPILIVL